MNPFDAVILGIIQGLTEFLPISSSAHVQIAQQALGLGDMSKPQLTAFIATIQLGTELAVLLYFWRDIVRIIRAFFGSFSKRRPQTIEAAKDAKMGWLIILGSLPVVVIGLVFQDLIENQLRSLWVIGVTLIVFGLLLGAADRYGKRKKGIDSLTTRDGLLFGMGQALAVIPGVSRSGGTISVGLMMGYSRQAAARYSFLLAIPAVIASGFYQFAKTYQDLATADLAATAVATLVSFGVGYSVIVVLLKYLNRGSFLPFVIWRVALGSTLLVLLSTGVLSA
ncbi:undecaprenyl-diphosphate phosphatase [Rhodoluna sp. KAS3]|uniref:undecaprenyl-diphosphate phosphatase n=1 Tax=Rhodoluna sp. KAS3 TaxID=942880 RepID=UPI0022326E76|nr:undecaprenyl-diphosphate phosphatase [Rhodoluna sp. KAS3]BDS48964.1 undecaprenyl-diphosphatase [Rhodoluna sp. KAS3]